MTLNNYSYSKGGLDLNNTCVFGDADAVGETLHGARTGLLSENIENPIRNRVNMRQILDISTVERMRNSKLNFRRNIFLADEKYLSGKTYAQSVSLYD